ncbi:hypothetical protein RB195_004228 [Necator americanus]|uniref:Uncharacterized protein n=1 Tax=Necator americanus TaxID=51031 RepID=A0ABR1BGZ0_NECAM
MSARSRTAFGPDRISSEHLKQLPPVLNNTLARLFTRCLSDARFLNRGRPTRPRYCARREIYMASATITQSAYLLSVIYKLLARVILNRIGITLGEGQPCEATRCRSVSLLSS